MKTFTEAEYLSNPQRVFEATRESMVRIVDADGRPSLTIGCTKPDTRENWEHALEELRLDYDDAEIKSIAEHLVQYFASQRGSDEIRETIDCHGNKVTANFPVDRGEEDGS